MTVLSLNSRLMVLSRPEKTDGSTIQSFGYSLEVSLSVDAAVVVSVVTDVAAVVSATRVLHPETARVIHSDKAAKALIFLMVLLKSVNKVPEHVAPVLEMPEVIV